MGRLDSFLSGAVLTFYAVDSLLIPNCLDRGVHPTLLCEFCATNPQKQPNQIEAVGSVERQQVHDF